VEVVEVVEADTAAVEADTAAVVGDAEDTAVVRDAEDTAAVEDTGDTVVGGTAAGGVDDTGRTTSAVVAATNFMGIITVTVIIGRTTRRTTPT
jgi:hypothetical protein